MYSMTQKELAPTEDQSILFFMATAPQTATIDYDVRYIRRDAPDLRDPSRNTRTPSSWPASAATRAPPSAASRCPRPPSGSARQMDAIQPELQGKLGQITGLRRGGLPAAQPAGAGQWHPGAVRHRLRPRLRELDGAGGPAAGRRHGQRQVHVPAQGCRSWSARAPCLEVDRDLAGDLGISMADLGASLASMLTRTMSTGSAWRGAATRSSPRSAQRFRNDAGELDGLLRPHRARRAGAAEHPGDAPPTRSNPSKRTQFQQLNSVTLSGVMAPGVTLGDALGYLEEQAQGDLPAGRALRLQGRVAPVQERGHAPWRSPSSCRC